MEKQLLELFNKITTIEEEIKSKEVEIRQLKLSFIKEHRDFVTGEIIRVVFPNHECEELEIQGYHLGVTYFNNVDLQYFCKVRKRNGKRYNKRKRQQTRTLYHSWLTKYEVTIVSQPHFDIIAEHIIIV